MLCDDQSSKTYMLRSISFFALQLQCEAVSNRSLCSRPATVCVCWSPGAPQKLGKSHWCVPFTATFSKRRKIGASWSERCDASKLQPAQDDQFSTNRTQHLQCANLIQRCYTKGYAAPSSVQCQCNMWRSPSKLKRTLPQAKIDVTSKSPVGDISVVTLIRTDTTLDHSQEADKVWRLQPWHLYITTSVM